MTPQTHATLGEIAAATGRDLSVVAKQAKKEGWVFEVEPGSARRRLYPLNSLSKAVRDPVRTYLVTQQIEKEYQDAGSDHAGRHQEISDVEEALRFRPAASGSIRGKLAAAELPDTCVNGLSCESRLVLPTC